jgi:uracil-DNA glycosylase
MESRDRAAAWESLQAAVAGCCRCLTGWRAYVTHPLDIDEIPDPPQDVGLLFVGVAPTPQEGPTAGEHFYSSPHDLLREGLFRLLSEPGFGLRLANLSLVEGNRAFHSAGCFFVHAAKVRPTKAAAPPHDVIAYCALAHLAQELIFLKPRAVCFLGKGNAAVAAEALFGRRLGGHPEGVRFGPWTGTAAVAKQPRRGWERDTREVVSALWPLRLTGLAVAGSDEIRT